MRVSWTGQGVLPLLNTVIKGGSLVGVGLYIVRTLCEQLGASVYAERRSRGARFVVTLRASQVRALARV